MPSLRIRVRNVFVDVAGDTGFTWIGECLHPRGDVDAVTEEIFAIDDHIAERDAYAEDELLLFR